MQIFFDDLALPRMTRTQLAEDAGDEDAPCRLLERRHAEQPVSVIRSMRGAIGRRVAIGAGSRAELARARSADSKRVACRRRSTRHTKLARADARSRQIAVAEGMRLGRIPYLDPIDLRFRNRVRVPVPMAKAVMFCLMDVSGSMDEARKDLSKRFFILLYLFLTRHYEKIDIVFIRHHTQAQEVDEENFFRARETGGTVVSSALVLMDEIIKARYSPSDWNIYAAQASDGDNWHHDSGRCRELLDRKPAAEVPLLRLCAGGRGGAEPLGGIRTAAGDRQKPLRDAQGDAGVADLSRCSAISSRPKESSA